MGARTRKSKRPVHLARKLAKRATDRVIRLYREAAAVERDQTRVLERVTERYRARWRNRPWYVRLLRVVRPDTLR